MASYTEFTNRFPDVFHGTTNDIDKSMSALEINITSKLDHSDSDQLTIAQASFALTTAYVTSYNSVVNGYLTEIKNRQSLIETANTFIAEMYAQKQQAINNKGTSGFTTGMRAWLDKQKILYDKYNGSNYSNPDNIHNEKEWEVNIESLNSYIKSRTNDVQTDVTKLNDMINKQNQIVQVQATLLKKITSLSESAGKNML